MSEKSYGKKTRTPKTENVSLILRQDQKDFGL